MFAGSAITTVTIIIVVGCVLLKGNDPVSSWYVKHHEWSLRTKRCSLAALSLPLKLVVIEHTTGVACADLEDCKRKVSDAQGLHMGRGYCEIKPSFLIGGDARVFEGRGLNKLEIDREAHVNKSLIIMFIGNYDRDQVTEEQFDHLKRFLDREIELKHLVADFKVAGAYQFDNKVTSPGINIKEKIQTWERWTETPELYI